MHRKHQDQQDGEPEIGQSHAQLCGTHQRNIRAAVMTGGGGNSDDQRDGNGERHGHQRQRQAHPQAFANQLCHGRIIGRALAKIAAQHAS